MEDHANMEHYLQKESLDTVYLNVAYTWHIVEVLLCTTVQAQNFYIDLMYL